MSRTKRRPYTGAKAIDPSCRKGECSVCKSNKTHKHKKRMPELDYEELDESIY